MKEIGGYFELEHFSGREYHANAVALNTARQALAYLIRAREIKKLYVPHYLCDSVFRVCKDESCPVEYYSVDASFLPVFDRSLAAGEWLYVVNYFGQLDNTVVRTLKYRFGSIILDNVQAFFQKPAAGVDAIYSCRKFFGVPDGAYLATDASLPQPLAQDASRDRMTHLLGRFETTASAWYGVFRQADEVFDTEPLKGMSALTQNLLRAVDYDAVRQQRNKNFAYLAERLREKNSLQLAAPDGPYCYPFYCENGLAIKRQLAAESIYVPTLWPNVLDTCGVDTLEYNYAANILPLPCDQRYGTEDMERMCRKLLELQEKGERI